jgi:general secretion pathway protein L
MRRILGLDLGSHAIKAVELRQTLRGVEVGQLRSVTVHEAAADDAESPSLPQQLQRFAALYRLPAEYVVAALPGDRVTTRRLALPFRERRRLAQAVPFELEGQMPFALEDVMVDWDVVRDEGSRAEVIALAAPRAEVGRQLETLREAGLEPRTLEAEGLALANLAALFPQPGTKLYVDMGHRKTTLTLCAGGKALAMRTIPIAGRALTQAVAQERRLVWNEAEGVKCDEGIQSCAAAHFVMDRLGREIMRTLGGFESALAGQAPLEELTLLGGSARLHGMDELLAERVGLPVVRMTFPRGEAGSALVAGGDPLLFSNALALALRGTLRATTRMNLRREEFAYRVDLRQIGRELTLTSRLAGLALLLGAVVLATSIAVQSRKADALERELRTLYAQAFPGQSPPANVGVAMREAVRSAHERADALGVYRGNLSALDLLSEISARVPQDLEVVFEELSIDRQMVRIRGYSKSFEGVDRLRTELSKFEPFSQIQVSEIQSDEKHGGKSFSVTISMGQKGEGG